MVFMIKSVLVSVLMAATTTTAKVHYDNPGRIINGTDAEPGDYPYYVGMVYCGGTLIAPDIVLFAAHCGDYTGKQVHVGDWKTTEFSQDRICAEWIPDPLYQTGGNLENYDFALCKLDEPALIDDSKFILELNNKDAVPKQGVNLIVIGAGYIAEGGPLAGSLQSVKVPAMTNDQCKQSDPYYENAITDSMLCAGYDEGEKDACQGDSGGPLVRRKKNGDGTFTDIHVGVVSWGIGCALANNPGVYARTSKRTDWIRETSCHTLGSSASWCDDVPAPLSCTEQSLIPLIVKVTTDNFGDETTWRVRDSNKEDIFERACQNALTETETTVCLKPDECYHFIIEDRYGDGMCSEGPESCGSYSLDLNNGEEPLTEIGDFSFARMIVVCTGDGVPEFCPDDLEWFQFNDKNDPIQTCENWVGVGKKKEIKKKCRMKYYGKKVSFWCPDTCGEVGLGKCASSR